MAASYAPAMVDFPTPPLADDTATTLSTSLICRFVGSPLCIRRNCGDDPDFGRPCEEYQLAPQNQRLGRLICGYQGILVVESSEGREKTACRHFVLGVAIGKKDGGAATYLI